MPLVSPRVPSAAAVLVGANGALLPPAPVTLGLRRVSAHVQRAGKAGCVGAGGQHPHLRAQGVPCHVPKAPAPQPCWPSPPHEDTHTGIPRPRSPPALSAVASQINHSHSHLYLQVPSGGPRPDTLSVHNDTSGEGQTAQWACSRWGKGRVLWGPVCDQLRGTARPQAVSSPGPSPR